jgi:hypothetical protein
MMTWERKREESASRLIPEDMFGYLPRHTLETILIHVLHLIVGWPHRRILEESNLHLGVKAPQTPAPQRIQINADLVRWVVGLNADGIVPVIEELLAERRTRRSSHLHHVGL